MTNAMRYWRVTAAATHPLKQGIQELTLPRVVSQSEPHRLKQECREHLAMKGYTVKKIIMEEYDPEVAQ